MTIEEAIADLEEAGPPSVKDKYKGVDFWAITKDICG